MADVLQNLERFRAWADLCPENFNHKYVLIRAEVARISRKTVAAMDLYDQARDQALASNFYLDATLSSISTSVCMEYFSAALDLLSMIKEKGKNRVEINSGCKL